MIRQIFIILMCIAILFLGCSQKKESGKKIEGINMKEGKWEITITMQATGKMPFQMPPQTFTQCITKENYVPQKFESNQDCRILKKEIKGDTVSWTVECKIPDGLFTSEGSVTYRGTAFDGIMKVKQKDIEMIQTMNGKWLGECK